MTNVILLAPLAIPLIIAGISAASAAYGAYQTNKTNKKNAQNERDLWEKNRKANLEDVRSQNLYNSPQQQMQRLREAGLSGNLVYGNKGVAQAGAMVKSSQGGTPNLVAPNLDSVGGIAQGFMDTRLKQAQTDNVQANTLKVFQDTAKSKEETNKVAMLKNAQLQELEERIDLTHQNARYRKGEADMVDVQEGRKYVESLMRERVSEQTLKNLKTIRAGMKNENKYKAYVGQLADKGININDPKWIRWLAQMFRDD